MYKLLSSKVLLFAILIIPFFGMNINEILSQPPIDPQPHQYQRRNWEIMNENIPKFNPNLSCNCSCSDMFESSYNWYTNENGIKLTGGYSIEGQDCHKMSFKLRNCSEEAITGIRFKFPNTTSTPCLISSFNVLKQNSTGPSTLIYSGLFNNTQFDYLLNQNLSNCETLVIEFYICKPVNVNLYDCWFNEIDVQIEILFNNPLVACPLLNYKIKFDGIGGVNNPNESGLNYNGNDKNYEFNNILYPNPIVQNEVNLKNIEKLVINNQITINVLDLQGKIVYSGKFNKTNYNDFKLPDLEQGNYYFIINNENETIFKEIINVNK